jgi:DNA repair exonuclease SbcCD nuclease subunit
MADFRFIHAADLHLDTPFEGVARAAPAVADALREASLEGWDNVVRTTLDEGAAFLLLAGDIYDGDERGVRAQLRFLRGLERLAERGVRVFVVHGNHDPVGARGGWRAIARWPAGVHVFGAREVEAVPVDIDGETAAVVYGISYDRRDTVDNLARRFSRGPGPGLHIGLLHANVGAHDEHAAYAPCTITDLRRARLDYWALGHVHRGHELARDPWVVYAGDTQGRSPKPAETGAKGIVVVDVTGTVVGEVRRVATDVVRFVHVAIDVDGLDGLDALRDKVAAEGEALRRAHEGRALLVRVRLVGRAPAHHLLRAPDARDGLLTDLREEWSGVSPFLWWESIADETRSPLDRDELSRRGDFVAELLAGVDRLRADASDRGALYAEVFAELGRGKPARWVGELDDDAGIELLQRAEERALDLLERQGT